MRRVLPAALACLALAAAPLPAAALTWEEAEAAGLRVGEVRVAREDVFDLTNPEEGHFLGRAANLVHVSTREGVVRDALLFGPGEPASIAVVRESERRLRALPWLIDASVEPVAAGPGTVDALVRTHDGWSLSLSFTYNHAGGDNLWAVWLEEGNLLGWGKQVGVSLERDLERTTAEVSYEDLLLFGSDWRLEAAWQDLSDGSGWRLLLERPYVRLDGPWSAGGSFSERDLVETLYDDASEVYSFPATLREGRLFASRRHRFAGRTARRVGLEYRVSGAAYGPLTVERPDELPPPSLVDRDLRGLLLTWAFAEDAYRICRNLQRIGSAEDVNLGREIAVAAGWAGPALGGDTEAVLAEGSLQAGRAFGEDAVLLLRAAGNGRVEGGEARDLQAAARATLYATGLPYQTVAADLRVELGSRLDPEHLLYIGGIEGLRGYPNHFRAGEGRWLLALEDRVITPWRIWGIAQVGFVGYVDAGAADAPGGGWTRTWADVGAGLRFGNLKATTTRVFSLTVAVPLVREDGVAAWQIVAGNTLTF